MSKAMTGHELDHIEEIALRAAIKAQIISKQIELNVSQTVYGRYTSTAEQSAQLMIVSETLDGLKAALQKLEGIAL